MLSSGLLLAAVRWLGLPGCIIVLMIVFYEGIPLANSVTPLLRIIPGVGAAVDDLAQGRVGRAYERGQRDADLAWQRRQAAAAALAQSAADAKQARLDAIASDYARQQIDVATQILDVTDATTQETADAANYSSGQRACRAVAIPRRVSDALDRVGRPARPH